MAEPVRCVPYGGIITGWDFSTGGVKCLAFDLEGRTVAEGRSVHVMIDPATWKPVRVPEEIRRGIRAFEGTDLVEEG